MDNTTEKKTEEPKKKVEWTYDASTSIMSASGVKAEKESQFTFKLERYKDSDTHEESIKITNYENGKENGFIVTSIVDLESDIKQFRKFGVVIEPTYFRDLCKRIEAVYLDIAVKKVSLDNDPRTDDLIAQVTEYVAVDKDLVTDDLCYVPVNMFNDLASDCGYSSYEMKTLRKQLATKKMIHVVGERYAILVRVKDKPERVIAFKREKLGVAKPVKKEKKQVETSGTDEA